MTAPARRCPCCSVSANRRSFSLRIPNAMNYCMLGRKIEHRERCAEGANALQLIVPFTSPDDAQAALNELHSLVYGLNAIVRVISVQSVPFGMALDQPPISVSYLKDAIGLLSSEYPIRPEIYITHEPELTWRFVLEARSVIVISGTGPWLSFAARRLARMLKRQGHRVCRLR